MFSIENISPNHVNTSKHPKKQNSNKKKCLNQAWSSFSRMLKIKKKKLSPSNSLYQKKLINIKNNEFHNQKVNKPTIFSLCLFYQVSLSLSSINNMKYHTKMKLGVHLW
jgi:type II restriction/modification system DNA methylase subunit YeeA